MTDITKQLKQWGKWARSDIDRLGYRSAWELVMRDNVEQHRGDGYDITDDYAGQIDTAVTRLASKGVIYWYVIVLRYVCGMTLREIRYAVREIDPNFNGGKLLPLTGVSEKLARAEGVIEGLIDKNPSSDGLS